MASTHSDYLKADKGRVYRISSDNECRDRWSEKQRLSHCRRVATIGTDGRRSLSEPLRNSLNIDIVVRSRVMMKDQ